MSGTVYLVGAGCGDADLITLRGLRILQQADAVVYDALIDEALLDSVPEQAERILVGKRAGKHSASQDEINRILVDCGRKYPLTVRLKGGDPFVFGRGGEEALALEQAGLPYEIIPGISSGIAAPEFAGIPVTHRGIARSFQVITAHDQDGLRDLRQYAKTGGTLVILMGLGRLRQILQQLTEAGISPQTPAAVIEKGGTAQQRVVRGTVQNLAALAENAKIEPPAVIVIGETAGFRLLSAQKKPLAGVSVTVTGTAHFSGRMAALLRARGAEVRCCCRMEIVSKDWSLRRVLSGQRWLVLTSANGVAELFRKMREERVDIRSLPQKIAVIGSGTAAALEVHGLYADLLPETFTAASLGAALAQAVSPGERLLILRAEQGSAQLTDCLCAAGLAYDDIKTYGLQGEQCTAAESDFLVFASASGVRAFFAGGGQIGAETAVVCIGQETAAALRTFRIQKLLIAEPHTAEGILELIERECLIK